jgi:hypothetical protein
MSNSSLFILPANLACIHFAQAQPRGQVLNDYIPFSGRISVVPELLQLGIFCHSLHNSQSQINKLRTEAQILSFQPLRNFRRQLGRWCAHGSSNQFGRGYRLLALADFEIILVVRGDHEGAKNFVCSTRLEQLAQPISGSIVTKTANIP